MFNEDTMRKVLNSIDRLGALCQSDWNSDDLYYSKASQAVQSLWVAYIVSSSLMKVINQEARLEKVAGQDLNRALVWCRSPAWWQRYQLHKPQRTLSDCSEIISLVQKLSAFTSSSRATEGFFYQTAHQRNMILDRRLQQATVGFRDEVTDTPVAANVEAESSS